MSTAKILKRNIYELVAEKLIAEISGKRLNPGDAIPTERELTELYGVGRSSIREGLRILESHGVIRPAGPMQYVLGDRGVALAPSLQMLLELGHADLREITELRQIHEVQAAKLAATRRSETDLQRIEQAIASMEAGLAGSRDQMLAADLEFHIAVAEASGNRAVLAVALGLRKVLESALSSSYWTAEDAVVQHRRVYSAIKAGRPEAAERRMREHLNWVSGILVEEIAASAPAIPEAP